MPLDIPAPPPEFWDWLEELAKSLLANLCKKTDPAGALAAIKNPSIRARLQMRRGMEQRFREAGQSDDFDAYGRHWLRDAYRQAQDMDLDDVEALLAA